MEPFSRRSYVCICVDCMPLSVLHLLAASLFHLLLTLALSAARGTFGGHGATSHKTLTSTGKGRVCQPGRVKGDHSLGCESVKNEN
jgi:hypothetical protein